MELLESVPVPLSLLGTSQYGVATVSPCPTVPVRDFTVWSCYNQPVDLRIICMVRVRFRRDAFRQKSLAGRHTTQKFASVL